MSDRNRPKHDSPLVTSVLRLENHLAELERVGGKITSMEVSSDVDLEHMQKLLSLFAECGEEISEEVRNLSMQLQQAQSRAEAIAREVSQQANALKVRRSEQQEYLERLSRLGERVHELNATLTADNDSSKPDIPVITEQLAALIGELQDLRNAARTSRLKSLERTADSLAQSLQSLQARLHNLS